MVVERLPEEQSFDRRLRPRVRAEVDLLLEIDIGTGRHSHSVHGKLVNLGGHGLSFNLSQFLDVAQVIFVEMTIEKGNTPFRTLGTIAWRQQLVPGTWQYGLKLTETFPGARKVLSAWLAEQLKDRSRLGDRRVAGNIISHRIEFMNRSHRAIVGVIDEMKDLPADAPIVLLPPTYGESKTGALTPSYYLATNGFRSIRYDGTDHVGESEGHILDCRLRTMADDLLSAVDYAQATYNASKVCVVASSLAARVAIKAAGEDPRITGLVILVGVVDLQATLKAVYHEDMIGSVLKGRRWDHTEVLGFEVEGAFLETAISDRFHNLATTLSDLKSTQASLTYIETENDLWVKAEDVRRVIAAAGGEIILLPGGSHQLFENRATAKMAMRMMVQNCLKFAIDKAQTLESIKTPSVRDIAFESRIEKERLSHLNSFEHEQQQGFWEKYLNGFDFILQSKEFCQLYQVAVQSVPPLSEKRVLDAGCGNGNFAVWLLEFLRLSEPSSPSLKRQRKMTEYVGTDYVESALIKAEERVRETMESLGRRGKAPHFSSSFVLADLNKPLPFRQNYFAVCFSNLVLSYVQDPLYTLREFYRVITTDGLLVLTSLKPFPDLSLIFHEFAKSAAGRRLSGARQLLNNAGGIRFRETEGHFRFFSGEELERFMHHAGFSNVRSFPVLLDQGVMVIGQKL